MRILHMEINFFDCYSWYPTTEEQRVRLAYFLAAYERIIASADADKTAVINRLPTAPERFHINLMAARNRAQSPLGLYSAASSDVDEEQQQTVSDDEEGFDSIIYTLRRSQSETDVNQSTGAKKKKMVKKSKKLSRHLLT